MATLKRSLLLCLLACLGMLSIVNVPAQAAEESDFFYLNLVWPGSFCKDASNDASKCCMPLTGEPVLDFLVESMETYDSYSGNVVTYCNETCQFSVNQLRNFITDMYSYWPDIRCPSNKGIDMWKSTFCKYGPCSKLTQDEYFHRALEIRKNLDLLNYLSTKGIVPSNTVKYDLEDIELALHAKLSFSFVLECKHKLQWRNVNEYQLLRVKICVSDNGKNIISCPISKETSCGSKVKIPPFTEDMLPENVIDKSNPIKMPFMVSLAYVLHLFL